MKGFGILNRSLKLSPHGIVGSAILHSLNKQNKASYIIKHIRDKLKTHPHLSLGNTKDAIHKFLHKHKHKILHIKDILGPNWNKKHHSLLNIIETGIKGKGFNEMTGEGKFWKSIKHIGKKAFHKLKQFVKGKTKFKPSMLAKIIASAADLAKLGLALDPRTKALVPIASVVGTLSRKGSEYLKKHGRGFDSKELENQMIAEGLEIPGGGLYPAGYHRGYGKKQRKRKIGSRQEVWSGLCLKTSSGLTKSCFMKHPKTGKIISIKRRALGLKNKRFLKKK